MPIIPNKCTNCFHRHNGCKLGRGAVIWKHCPQFRLRPAGEGGGKELCGGDEEGCAVSTGYSSRAWDCPFFKWDEQMKIHCEGGCAAFPDKRARGEYISRYCGNNPGWRSCTLASTLEKHYERNG